MLSWMNTRLLKLGAVEFSVSNLHLCAKISHCLCSVRRLELYTSIPDISRNEFDSNLFQNLIQMLPLLTDLDMTNFVPNDMGYLLAILLAASTHLLKRLVLDGMRESCEGLVPFLSVLSNLECVDLGASRPITAITLRQLASKWRNLRELTFACVLTDAEETIAAMASLSQLQRIKISNEFDRGVVISHPTAMAIFQQHPYLTHFVASWWVMHPVTCGSILSGYPQLIEFTSGLFALQVVTTDDKAKHCEVTLDQYDIGSFPSNVYAEGLLQVSSSCVFPITLLCSMCMRRPLLNPQDILRVIDAMGKTLQHLSIVLNTTAEDDHVVEHVALKCPHLQLLHLHSCTHITDRSLSTIANHCRLLADLTLHDARLIEDHGVCCIINRFGAQLTHFKLTGCALLTHTSMLAIFTICSKLKVLELFETGIAMEDIQKQLFCSNCLPLLESFLVAGRDYNTLTRAIYNSTSKVAWKWGKALTKSDR